jgi:hypothetical protein
MIIGIVSDHEKDRLKLLHRILVASQSHHHFIWPVLDAAKDFHARWPNKLSTALTWQAIQAKKHLLSITPTGMPIVSRGIDVVYACKYTSKVDKRVKYLTDFFVLFDKGQLTVSSSQNTEHHELDEFSFDITFEELLEQV